MQGSGYSGGGRGSHDGERWFREILLAKNPLGMIAETSWQPPTDVFETDDAVVVRMEIPGINPEMLSIRLVDDVLTIQGVRDDCCEHHKVKFQQLEIHSGQFKRSIPLRYPIVYEEVAATYRQGFLSVVMPRAKQEHSVSAFYIKIKL